jgi:small subunit ribosomal protein S9
MENKKVRIFIGRRKTSIARILIKEGSGNFTVNGMPADTYFRRKTLGLIIRQPLQLVEGIAKFDVSANVSGGGWSGQAGALRMGISRGLVEYNENWRGNLKKAGFLTRDSRKVERKKYGRKKARKSFQFSKR